MTMWLRQSTASQEILLGPCLDSTDGNTQETGLTIANTDIKLWKEGATSEANKNSGGATHIANGRYYAVLDATDTNTLGKLEINVHMTGALAVRREYMVLPANVYDALVLGTDYLDVSAVQLAGQTITAAAGVTFPSSVASPTNITAGTIATVTNLTNLPSIPAGWLTAAGIAAAALNGKGDWQTSIGTGSGLTAIPWNSAWDTEVQSEVQDAIEANHLDHLLAVDYDPASKPGVATALLNELVESNGGVSRYTAGALALAPSGTGASAASIVAAMFTQNTGETSASAVAGSPVYEIVLNAGSGGGSDWNTNEKTAIRAILGIPASGTTPSDPTTGILDTIRDAVIVVDDLLDTEMPALTVSVAAIKAKTDNLPSDPADASDIAAAIAVTNGKVDAVQADTDNIQTRIPAALVGGRMDSNLSAIGSSTTALTAFQRGVKGNVIGTIGVGSTTTSLVTSAFVPAGSVSTQFKGRIITFMDDTTTAALRGQSTDITASTASATPTLTVTALTTAPASGDTFVIT